MKWIKNYYRRILFQKRQNQEREVMKSKPNQVLGFVLLCILGLAISCEPDEDPIDLGGSNIGGCQTVTPDTLHDMEIKSFKVLNSGARVYVAFGFSFSVDFPGSITEMGIMVPENGSYTVRIYNADELKDDVLAETEITASNRDWNFVSIDPLALSPAQEYIACIYIPSKAEQQESLFYHTSNFVYPLEKGDLNIKGYAWKDATNEKVKPVFQPGFTLHNGLVDICFEAD